MAIDTENKRRSVQAYTFGLMRPVADSTILAPDRATVGWLYSGLTYAAPSAFVADTQAGYMSNGKSFTGPLLSRQRSRYRPRTDLRDLR